MQCIILLSHDLSTFFSQFFLLQTNDFSCSSLFLSPHNPDGFMPALPKEKQAHPHRNSSDHPSRLTSFLALPFSVHPPKAFFEAEQAVPAFLPGQSLSALHCPYRSFPDIPCRVRLRQKEILYFFHRLLQMSRWVYPCSFNC